MIRRRGYALVLRRTLFREEFERDSGGRSTWVSAEEQRRISVANDCYQQEREVATAQRIQGELDRLGWPQEHDGSPAAPRRRQLLFWLAGLGGQATRLEVLRVFGWTLSVLTHVAAPKRQQWFRRSRGLVVLTAAGWLAVEAQRKGAIAR